MRRILIDDRVRVRIEEETGADIEIEMPKGIAPRGTIVGVAVERAVGVRGAEIEIEGEIEAEIGHRILDTEVRQVRRLYWRGFR